MVLYFMKWYIKVQVNEINFYVFFILIIILQVEIDEYGNCKLYFYDDCYILMSNQQFYREIFVIS